MSITSHMGKYMLLKFLEWNYLVKGNMHLCFDIHCHTILHRTSTNLYSKHVTSMPIFSQLNNMVLS